MKRVLQLSFLPSDNDTIHLSKTYSNPRNKLVKSNYETWYTSSIHVPHYEKKKEEEEVIEGDIRTNQLTKYENDYLSVVHSNPFIHLPFELLDSILVYMGNNLKTIQSLLQYMIKDYDHITSSLENYLNIISDVTSLPLKHINGGGTRGCVLDTKVIHIQEQYSSYIKGRLNLLTHLHEKLSKYPHVVAYSLKSTRKCITDLTHNLFKEEEERVNEYKAYPHRVYSYHNTYTAPSSSSSTALDHIRRNTGLRYKNRPYTSIKSTSPVNNDSLSSPSPMRRIVFKGVYNPVTRIEPICDDKTQLPLNFINMTLCDHCDHYGSQKIYKNVVTTTVLPSTSQIKHTYGSILNLCYHCDRTTSTIPHTTNDDCAWIGIIAISKYLKCDVSCNLDECLILNNIYRYDNGFFYIKDARQFLNLMLWKS